MPDTSFHDAVVDRLERLVLASGGSVPTMTSPDSYQETTISLLEQLEAALQAGGGGGGGATALNGLTDVDLTSPTDGQTLIHQSGVWVNAPAPANGNDGADGKTILNGTTAPGAGVGVDGDFYINTTAWDLYGPKTGGAWGSATSLIGPQGNPGNQGDPGTPGNDGADGKTILNGTTAPGAGVGVDGDFYLDTALARLYGPKMGGAWGSFVSLIGPQGNPGNQGDPGSDGADGRTILNGTVAPTTEGVNGDFYIRTDTNELYGPKIGGAWGSPTLLRGAIAWDLDQLITTWTHNSDIQVAHGFASVPALARVLFVCKANTGGHGWPVGKELEPHSVSYNNQGVQTSSDATNVEINIPSQGPVIVASDGVVRTAFAADWNIRIQASEFSPQFASSGSGGGWSILQDDIAWTQSSQITIAHGGSINVAKLMLKVTSNRNGYSVGDILDADTFGTECGIRWDATNVYVAIGDSDFRPIHVTNLNGTAILQNNHCDLRLLTS